MVTKKTAAPFVGVDALKHSDDKRRNPDLHMAGDLKNTGAGNLFVVFGEPDIRIEPQPDGRGRVREKGAEHPSWEGPRVTDCQGSPAYSFSFGFGTVPTCGP